MSDIPGLKEERSYSNQVGTGTILSLGSEVQTCLRVGLRVTLIMSNPTVVILRARNDPIS